MKTKFNKVLLLVLNILIFIFFIGFIYFAYFSAKELLVVKYITPQDYSVKFYRWELSECNNPYKYDERNIKSSKSNSEIFQEKENCLNNLYTTSENRRNVDFKYNFIKYGLATLFFLVLFLMFSAQNMLMFRGNKEVKDIIKSKK